MAQELFTEMKAAIIWITVIFLSLTAVIFAYFGYPLVASGDGSWFVVPGINYALTGELESPFYWGEGVLRAGNGPFLAYPPLFPLFVSLFVFSGVGISIPAQIFIGISIVTGIVLALSAYVLYRVAVMRGHRLDWLTVLVICASLFMIFRLSWGFGARPEVLLRLFFAMGFLIFLGARYSWISSAILGILLGLIAATHVIGFVFFFAVAAFALAIRYNFLTGLKHLVFIASTGLISFAAAMQLSPFGIAETVSGIRLHASLMVARTSQASALRTMFESTDAVMFTVVGALLLFVAARPFLGFLRGKKVSSPLLLVSSIVVMGGYAAFAVAHARNYYITPFFLFFSAVFLYYIVHVDGSRVVKKILAVAFAAVVVISMKYLALFPFSIKDGLSFPAAREKFSELVAQSSEKPIVLMGAHLWTLSESYLLPGKILIDVSEPPRLPSEYFVVIEEFDFPEAPEEKKYEFDGRTDECAVDRTFYTGKKPEIFGVTIARTLPSYAFMVYDCRSRETAERQTF